MSEFTQDPLRHDFFVGLACRRLLLHLEGSKVVSLDGGVPFEDCIAPTPKSLLGYRPDAIIEHNGNFWIIEVKSESDIQSSHTRSQLSIVKTILDRDERWNFYLVVFDCKDKLLQQRFLKRIFPLERGLIESVVSEGVLSGTEVST